jgi:toxin ParE1/3/4
MRIAVWDDFREIELRIAKDNPDAAGGFFHAAKAAFELVARHPAIGRLRSFSLAGVRSWVVPGFENYVVFYLPTETEVQILTVLHGARDLPKAMQGRVD